jgi:hypothetical protein
VIAPQCPHHDVAMEMLPSQPRSRCSHCGHICHELERERCPECGHPMELEEPEPHWICPLCPAEMWHSNEQEPFPSEEPG